jgi:hypothetical protein
LNIEVKKEIRNYQIPQILDKAAQFGKIIVIAKHLFPKIKEEFRQNQIAYLEENGNIFLKEKGILLWIDTQKNNPVQKEKGNRAFTKTGLRITFHFLMKKEFINMPYREIAQKTGVGLGNINYVINGLKDLGFLIKINKLEYALNNRKEMFEKWMAAYEERLKPALLMGTFRFMKEEDIINWKNIQLADGETFWGGEPAGDLMTNYLQPNEWTIYTTETRNELIKNYKLVPDEKGNVKVFKKFWQLGQTDKKTVPPLLVYADLINKQDGRCRETADLILTNFLKDEF